MTAIVAKSLGVGAFILTTGAYLPTSIQATGAGEASSQDETVREREARVRLDLSGGQSRSHIGISIVDVERVAADRGLGTNEGAVVDGVESQSPAAAAGVRVNDVVVEFDGERVRSARQLARLVEETPAGRTVVMTVLRDGMQVGVELTPAAGPGPGPGRLAPAVELERAARRLRSVLRPGPGPRFAERVERRVRRGRPLLGIRAEPVGGQLAEYFGVVSGILVSHVSEESVASAAGLRAGDVITAVDGMDVDEVAALRRRLARVEMGGDFELTITRDGAALTLPATMTAPEGGRRRRRPHAI